MNAVSYNYVKVKALSAKEKQRIRVSISSELGLKNAMYKNRQTLVGQLINLCQKPLANINFDLIEWLLSFGRPTLLQMYMQALSELYPEPITLMTIKHANSIHILPREYINPDFQKIQFVPQPKTALICFTGGAHRLNIPIQLFHFLAAQRFDLIFYLRDFAQQCFMTGIPTIANNVNELAKGLGEQIPRECHIAVLGTSAGGYAAAQFSEAIRMQRLAMFSPPFWFNDLPPTQDFSLNPSQVKLFFASGNDQDLRFVDLWSRTNYGSSINLLDTVTHGTLKYLFVSEQLHSLFDWLLEKK